MFSHCDLAGDVHREHYRPFSPITARLIDLMVQMLGPDSLKLVLDSLKRELVSLVNLLRLIDSIRVDLQLVLVRVLIALSHRPNATNIVFLLLESVRCFGHRDESGRLRLGFRIRFRSQPGSLPTLAKRCSPQEQGENPC